MEHGPSCEVNTQSTGQNIVNWKFMSCWNKQRLLPIMRHLHFLKSWIREEKRQSLSHLHPRFCWGTQACYNQSFIRRVLLRGLVMKLVTMSSLWRWGCREKTSHDIASLRSWSRPWSPYLILHVGYTASGKRCWLQLSLTPSSLTEVRCLCVHFFERLPQCTQPSLSR